MTRFADCNFYLLKYLSGKNPTVEPSVFSYYATQASMKIKQYTFDNISQSAEIPEEVKMCCCEVAELMYAEDRRQSETNGVLSESVGNWSKSYESGEKTEQLLERKIKAAVCKWLSNMGLLYCGVGEC